MDFYDGQEFEGTPIETKILKGNKFWAMGGFGLDIVAQSKRPSLSVRFNADLKPDFLENMNLKYLVLDLLGY